MRYRVDLVSHCSVVVEAEDEKMACKLAEDYVNGVPEVNPTFEVEDGGIEECNDEPEVIQDDF